jgi:bacteriocin-like protein
MFNIFKKTKKEVSTKVEKLNAKELKNVIGGDGEAESTTTYKSGKGVIVGQQGAGF